MITQEDLIAVALADSDAEAFDGVHRQAKDTCMDVWIAGGIWTCLRHRGHLGIHVDPSIKPSRGQFSPHRWVTSTYTHADFMALPPEERKALR